ncbi:MAG TPA: carnitine 3-dehydrogenase [Solirubrobacteraceae bacterium]|jgi:carnitine 3-dehydrogenase|nr:carnitine 3-dehydrogenase [Solirubrobacteraceae bacterium]
MTELPRLVALLGGGVIGGGWAARFALNGVDVRIYDPDPDAARTVREVLASARRAQRRLTLAPLPAEGTVTLVATVEEAVEEAAFVQESAPEREALKRDLLAAASRAAAPDAIIASSTSGLLPTRLAAGMEHPGRFTVGHPFNPVYLLPLVELCGGERTAPETLARAAAIYRALGMRPLVLRTEVDAFVADRLLEALWREALWLVAEDVATVAEIDDAIRFGAGLRWAFMGTFLTYRIAGGEAGMRHFMEQFGPTLELPWTRLTDAPELTSELLDKLVAQSDEQAAGRSVRELERLRDDCLISIIQGLRGHDFGAGAVLAEYERALCSAAPAAPADEHEAPLRLHSAVVAPEWIDYNGHATESRYLQVFGDTTDALLRHIGLDPGAGSSYFTVETHLSHLGQALAEEGLHTTTQLLGHDDKRLHVFHSLYRSADDELLATAEQMLLHVDTAAGRAGPAAPALLKRIARIAEAHAALPRPERAGRAIGLLRA